MSTIKEQIKLEELKAANLAKEEANLKLKHEIALLSAKSIPVNSKPQPTQSSVDVKVIPMEADEQAIVDKWTSKPTTKCVNGYKTTTLKNGTPMYVRDWHLKEDKTKFFEYYRNNKNYVYSLGFSPRKLFGTWYLSHWIKQ